MDIPQLGSNSVAKKIFNECLTASPFQFFSHRQPAGFAQDSVDTWPSGNLIGRNLIGQKYLGWQEPRNWPKYTKSLFSWPFYYWKWWDENETIANSPSPPWSLSSQQFCAPPYKLEGWSWFVALAKNWGRTSCCGMNKTAECETSATTTNSLNIFKCSSSTGN